MSKVIRIQQVVEKTGLSRSSIYELCKKQCFPKQVSLTSRTVGWLESEVDSWIADRASCRLSDFSA